VAQLTAQGIAGMAAALLRRRLVLASTVSAVDGGDFTGGNGDTVTVRVPQPTTAREQVTPGTQITFDNLSEVPVDVQVLHLYHATKVTDEALTLELVDYARQITLPQVTAVATKAENQIAAVINSRASDISIAADGSDIDAAVLEARELLGRNEVPLDDRFLAVSPEVATFLLQTEQLTMVDHAGTPSALRDAIIGRYRGFTVVESSGIEAGEAAAYHRSGIVWGNVRPATPRGATAVATHTEGGINMRQIFQYMPDYLSDASVVSTFAGASLVAEDGTGTNGTVFKRLVKLGTAAS
jgi:hypothetical protein